MLFEKFTERDRHLHLIPILRRTRMSVVEFKERMGLNVNQSQPMAQILKNIISGINAAGITGEEAKEANKNIPDLPANLSTQVTVKIEDLFYSCIYPFLS